MKDFLHSASAPSHKPNHSRNRDFLRDLAYDWALINALPPLFLSRKLLESHEINVIAYNLNSKEAGKTSFQK